MNEIESVSSLFDQQLQLTLGFLSSLEEGDWQIKMHPWDSMLFQGLVSNVSIAEVIKHTAMVEQHIIHSINSLEDGAVISTEGDVVLCDEKKGGKIIVACYKDVHKENLNGMASLSKKDLTKKFTFISQPYTGIGLLWMLIGHHAFHLGQIRSICFPRSK